jgi:peptidoglycan hydrolase CwlO-like protein
LLTAVPRRFAHISSVARRQAARGLPAAVGVSALFLVTGLTPPSAGDLQSQIASGRSAAASLQSRINGDTSRIKETNASLSAAEHRLTALQAQLNARQARLRAVQSALLSARNHLVDLENRLRVASKALAANLVSQYEGQQPDLIGVILQSNSFSNLLDQLNFLRRISDQDAHVVGVTRSARVAVKHQVTLLGTLEQKDLALTRQVLSQRNQVAALHAALLHRQIDELRARRGATAKLSALNSKLHTLEVKAARQAAQQAATGNAPVGGIAVDTGGMVQPPPGAPAAVREVIAAGNAIATLPYIYGGGHASFQANGYDCSGSVSYALAAAGLVSTPMVSGQFESRGDPGPGRWITIYANADHVWMDVAGWRFDTVALAEGGTRWAQGGGEFAGFVVRHPPGL